MKVQSVVSISRKSPVAVGIHCMVAAFGSRWESCVCPTHGMDSLHSHAMQRCLPAPDMAVTLAPRGIETKLSANKHNRLAEMQALHANDS